MDLQQIIAAVGEETYRESGAQATRAAPFTGKERHPLIRRFDSDVPHDINDLIWDSALSDDAKVALAFRVYGDIPCYAVLMGCNLGYNDLSETAQAAFWSHVRGLLASDDAALSVPVEYALWCDFFERPDRVERAWRETTEGADDRTLQRLLIASGPVPYVLKEHLYARLIEKPAWHYYIYRSLLHSAFDVYGNVVADRARAVLQRLSLPSDTEHLQELWDRLSVH